MHACCFDLTHAIFIPGGRLAFEPNETLGVNREVEATPVNMFTSSSLNQFVFREGEAPAEPWRPQLGRSLALPSKLQAIPKEKT